MNKIHSWNYNFCSTYQVASLKTNIGKNDSQMELIFWWTLVINYIIQKLE